MVPRRGGGVTLTGPPTTCAGYGPSVSALGWMGGRAEPPKDAEQARLPGGGPKVGKFWTNCKTRKKCGRSPYDRLLTNPVLRADYDDTKRKVVNPGVTVQALRTECLE